MPTTQKLITVLALSHSFFQDTRVPRERGGPIQFLEETVPHPEREPRDKGATCFMGVASVSPEIYAEFYEHHPSFLGFDGSVRDDARAAMDAHDDQRGVHSTVKTVAIPVVEAGDAQPVGAFDPLKDDGDPSNDNPLKGLDWASPNAGELALAIDGLNSTHFEGMEWGGKIGYTTADVRKAAKALRK